MFAISRIDDRELLFKKLQEIGVIVIDDGVHDFSLEFEDGTTFYVGVDSMDDTLYIEKDGGDG